MSTIEFQNKIVLTEWGRWPVYGWWEVDEEVEEWEVYEEAEEEHDIYTWVT